MSRKKPIEVIVSNGVSRLIKKEINKKQIENHYLIRMQIILLSSQGGTNPEISKQLNIARTTVSRWRLRWSENIASLTGIERDYASQKNKDRIIIRKIKSVLSDSYRSGSSCKINDMDKVRIQALACESPSDYGLPFTVWTHVELSKQAGKMGVKISSSHLGRVLKKRFTTPQV